MFSADNEKYALYKMCDMRISAICAVKAAVPLRSDICCFDNLQKK